MKYNSILFLFVTFLTSSALFAGGHADDVDARDYAGYTPLHRAVQQGNVAEVERLLFGGANIEANGDFPGETPLFIAASTDLISKPDKVKIVEILLRHGANPNVRMTAELGCEMPLHNAAKNGDKEVVSLLLTYGANPCAKCGATLLGRVIDYSPGEQNLYTAHQLARTEECKNILQQAEKWRRQTESSCVVQ